ncbi:unnamed protein product, partial [Staurois parvus]
SNHFSSSLAAFLHIEKYCASCDWSQLVTWYKAFVNSLVPCDLCDHSQISHIVSNDVRSDILLTTLHVITDWPISDHMIGTSYRGPVRRSVFFTVSGGHSGHRIAVCALPGSAHKQGARRAVYRRPPDPAVPPSGRLYTTAGREVVK